MYTKLGKIVRNERVLGTTRNNSVWSYQTLISSCAQRKIFVKSQTKCRNHIKGLANFGTRLNIRENWGAYDIDPISLIHVHAVTVTSFRLQQLSPPYWKYTMLQRDIVCKSSMLELKLLCEELHASRNTPSANNFGTLEYSNCCI